MKKRTLKILFVACLIAISTIWYACKKETSPVGKGEVEFNVGNLGSSNLKSSKSSLDSADYVLITIVDDVGNPTDYTLYELKLKKFGEGYITKKIALDVGDYQVTEFYILDKNDSIIYASPLELSIMAQNVEDPLPIIFNVYTGASTPVEVEVISTDKLKPEDFGLIAFPAIEVETFQFLVSVSEIGTNQLLAADLIVTSGSYTYSQPLDSVIDNIVTVKDGYTDYILTIESAGYQTYVDTLTNVELKQYDSIPLVVELKIGIPTEGLVAYYPFNGNANDESGNGYNGAVYGATLTTDRNGDINSAYSFNGSSDYITVSDSYTELKLTPPLAISFWVYINNVNGNQTILAKGDAAYRYYRFSVIDGKIEFHIGGYGSYLISNLNVFENTWYHIIGGHDGIDNKYLFINGNYDNSLIATSSSSYSSNQPLTFATSQTLNPSFNGKIDDVRFYNHNLTESEILALYNE